MLLTEDDLETLEDDFDIDCPPALADEFNARVSVPDEQLVVDDISNELHPVMAEIYRSTPLANYKRLRELEKTTKAFFIYKGLIDAATAHDEPLVERRLWQLEAARRIGHEATSDLTFYHDGQLERAAVWSTTNEMVIMLEDVDDASPLAPVERRINELVDEAAAARLDWSDHEDVSEYVRRWAEELPSAAAKLERMDAERIAGLTQAFRHASRHPLFADWFATTTAEGLRNTHPLDTYLAGNWDRSVILYRRGKYLDRADWLLAMWEDSDESVALVPAPMSSTASVATPDDAAVELQVGADADAAGATTILARLSWTAYVGLMVQALLALGIAVPLAFALHPGLGAVVAVAALGYLVYRAAFLRSVVLLCDDDGVWVHRGVFPWDTGAFGVKWRDLDEAVFFPGFLDWMLHSHTIALRHRFTQDEEIVLAHVAQGDDVVTEINARHVRGLEASDG